MKSLVPRRAIWARELDLAKRPEVWHRFALELRACAEFLGQQDREAVEAIFEGTSSSRVGFFAPKFVRLIMGLSLENLTKGILLSGPKAKRFTTRDRISFGKKGHDLAWLLTQADIALEEPNRIYIEAWSASAEWFGKYPFPVEMNRVLDEYAPLTSSEALTRRVLRGRRGVTVRDILHGGVGLGEWRIFRRVFTALEKQRAA